MRRTPSREQRARQRATRLVATLALLVVLACAETSGFDRASYLREQLAAQGEAALASSLEVPFELDPEVLAVVDEELRPVGGASSRVARILDFVFRDLELEYRLAPTASANEVFARRQANCLGFSNLFVGVGRRMGLDPFYVEVEDYRRWDHRDGLVVSRGHIVAGLYVDGQLPTNDFLPYRPKSYRRFEPIDDRRATAHFYNNLGAEALMDGEIDAARRHLETATRVDPGFVEAANNLGVVHARAGESERAAAIYRRALEAEPESVALLTNLARAYQQLGRLEEAEALLARVEKARERNPFFFVYKGEQALARGETEDALEYLREALREASETPEVHLGLVKVYLALGELKKAEHHLERARRLDAAHPEAERLERLLRPLLQAAGPAGS